MISAGPKVWGIGDPHWSTTKPMEIYHEVWRDHRARLLAAWRERIAFTDLVIVAGDVTFDKVPITDLAELHNLPGQVVIVPGNHDWWVHSRTVSKVRQLLEPFPSLHLLTFEQPFYETGDHLIVGWKGSEPPESPRFVAKHHQKTVAHARNAVDQALQAKSSTSQVIMVTHYPPSVEERRIAAPLEPKLWLHGHSHLHGDDEALVRRWMAERTSPPQHCISSDYLDHTPVEVTHGTYSAY